MTNTEKYKELIEHEIIERGISVRALAKEMKISYQTIYAILHLRYDAVKTTTQLKLDNYFGLKAEPTREELQAQIGVLEAQVAQRPDILNRVHIDPYESDRLKKTYLAEDGNVRFFARLSGVDAKNPQEWFGKLRPETQDNLLKLFWLFDQIVQRNGPGIPRRESK